MSSVPQPTSPNVQTTPLLIMRDVVKEYPVADGVVSALRGVSLEIGANQVIIIRGRSGAGKTTLLNIVAGLDTPTRGTVTLFGHNVATLSENARARLRRTELGFIFQSAHLFPTLTALENVQVPLRLSRTKGSQREQRAREALALVGLAERQQHRAAELSGGEQQRVAIARALVHAPRMVLADEPTGNLDSHTGLVILELIRSVAHDAGITFVITTHDPQAPAMADMLYDINDGMLARGLL